MPINVTCPSCLKRFTVSEKFAGKSGPCPNCQKPIKIPEKSDEVVIHAPEDSGPRDSTGRPVFKPIRRKDVKIRTPIIVGAIVSAVVVFAIAFGLGLSGAQPSTAVLALGALLVAPPLVFVGYWFLRDDELEGYHGRQLILRCGICALTFAGLWGLYAFVPRYVSGYATMEEYSGLDMVIFLPLMLIIGTVVAVAVLELEVIQGVLHYMLYFGTTFVLAWLAGAHLAEPLSGGNSGADKAPPSFTQPADSQPDESEDAKQIPNLLQ